MKDNEQNMKDFLAQVKPTQMLWALQDKASEDWVVLDSVNYQETEVMPVWSGSELAEQHCCEEWKEYVPCAITLADWLEFWVTDLNDDGVIIGINWPTQGDCLEMELAEFTQSVAQIEAL